MSKKRYLDTKFWDDGFVRSLNADDKLLFIYFITNPLTELCGIYEISIERMVFDTGLEKGMVRKGLERLNQKITYVDGWIFIKNFAKHQTFNKNMKIGSERSKKGVPSLILDKMKGMVPKASEGVRKPELKLELKLKEMAETNSAPSSKKTNPIIKQLIDYWYQRCIEIENKKPVISAKDAVAVKSALETYKQSIDEIKTTINWYLIDSKKYLEQGLNLNIALSSHSINLSKNEAKTLLQYEQQHKRTTTS